jgi:Arc/MetJ-type ribon-helix-helix transcriptional regulator
MLRAMVQIAVRLDEDDLAEVDRLVAEGRFASRTAAVRAALRYQRRSTVLTEEPRTDPEPEHDSLLVLEEEAREQIELLVMQARRVLALCYDGPMHRLRTGALP